MLSLDDPENFGEVDPPAIPIAVIDWLETIFETPEIVTGRSLEEWNFLAGVEEVKRILKQTFDDQQANIDSGKGADPLAGIR